MIDQLLAKFPIVSDQIQRDELRVLLQSLEKVVTSGVAGSVVELGCYKGTASLFMQRLLDAHGDGRQLCLYDSFEGLPEKTTPDASPLGIQFVAGELLASCKDVTSNFRRAGLRTPEIRKAWFADLRPEDMPRSIALAFLDGDYYESIRDSLRLVWPRLSPGAIVVVDDYANQALPGAARAVDEWLRSHQGSIRVAHSLAVVGKK
jgi:O-methyltransferase